MILSETLFTYILSRFKKTQKEDHYDNISLEVLNKRIRIFVWAALFIHMLGVTFFSETRVPTIYYVVCLSGWVLYLVLLLKSQSEFLKGIPFLIINLGATVALIQKGEPFYLRIITISLPTLPVYSVQGFPPVLVLILGAGYLWLQEHYLYYLDTFYEPITSTYRIPATSIHNVVKGYRVALFLVVLCLTTYQVIIQRLWKNYQKAKKNLEEKNQQVQAANLQLAKSLEELANLNTQLQHALESQDLFVACVSHELRNPLNVMLGSLDLLEPHIKESGQIQLLKTTKICGDALLSQINNLLDVAKINADKIEISEFCTNMGTFLEKFWTFTRIGLEKKKLSGYLSIDKNMSLWLNIDAHRLHQILNNLVGNAVKFTTKGSIRIKFQWIKGTNLILSRNQSIDKIDREKSLTSTEEPLAEEDESCMDLHDFFEGESQQPYNSTLLQNKTASNSFLTFEPHQSVREALESTLPTYENCEESFLKISIVDSGCGILKEVQETIFEPFVQGDRSVTRKYGGTGLGLYIVKNLVTKMGGSIKINSRQNKGTDFQIILPVKSVRGIRGESREGTYMSAYTNHKLRSLNVIQKSAFQVSRWQSEQSSRTPEVSELPELELENEKVLIVDDDLFNQNLLKEYFKKFNLGCDFANNGLEGVEKYKSNPDKYSFITMDIQMPIMDGITACKEIRKYERSEDREKIPIAIITGNCSEDERKACLENKEIEANCFFRKPFRLADCKSCIDNIVGEAATMKEIGVKL